VGFVLAVVLLLELVDFVYQGLFHRFYPGALDNGSGMLVLKQISDLLDNVPHWMLQTPDLVLNLNQLQDIYILSPIRKVLLTFVFGPSSYASSLLFAWPALNSK